MRVQNLEEYDDFQRLELDLIWQVKKDDDKVLPVY